MTAAEKYTAIVDALLAGRTVYLSTVYTCRKITPKTWRQWQDYGRPVLKLSGRSLYLASGKNYLCADGCAITIQ